MGKWFDDLSPDFKEFITFLALLLGVPALLMAAWYVCATICAVNGVEMPRLVTK